MYFAIYYEVIVKYKGEQYPLYINVGLSKYDKTHHIYDITKKIRDTANRINGLGRLSLNESDALENGISNNNVPQESDSVKRSEGKFSERDTDSTEYKINTSMTMSEAKRMIETAFKVHGIYDFYDGRYANADEWLKAEGADEIELYIENDYDLQAKYINSNEDTGKHSFTLHCYKKYIIFFQKIALTLKHIIYAAQKVPHLQFKIKYLKTIPLSDFSAI